MLETLGLTEPLFPVAWEVTVLPGKPLPETISYKPGGRVVGMNGSCPDIEDWMRYMAMIKSVTSSDPRLCVSDKFLPRGCQGELLVEKHIRHAISERVYLMGAWT